MKTIETQIEKLETELAKLKDIVNKPKSYKRWRAEYGEYYYYIDINGVYINTETDDDMDDSVYNIGNYYKTREEAQKVLDKQFAITKVNDRIRELNEGWEPNWDNSNEKKFNIYYNFYGYCYDIVRGNSNFFNSFILYIKSQQLAEQIIEELKPELNIIFDIK